MFAGSFWTSPGKASGIIGEFCVSPEGLIGEGRLEESTEKETNFGVAEVANLSRVIIRSQIKLPSTFKGNMNRKM